MGKGASNAKALGQEQACLGTWWARWGQAGGGRDRGAPETSLIRTEGSSPRCEDINVPNLLLPNTFHPQTLPHRATQADGRPAREIKKPSSNRWADGVGTAVTLHPCCIIDHGTDRQELARCRVPPPRWRPGPGRGPG